MTCLQTCAAASDVRLFAPGSGLLASSSEGQGGFPWISSRGALDGASTARAGCERDGRFHERRNGESLGMHACMLCLQGGNFTRFQQSWGTTGRGVREPQTLFHAGFSGFGGFALSAPSSEALLSFACFLAGLEGASPTASPSPVLLPGPFFSCFPSFFASFLLLSPPPVAGEPSCLELPACWEPSSPKPAALPCLSTWAQGTVANPPPVGLTSCGRRAASAAERSRRENHARSKREFQTGRGRDRAAGPCNATGSPFHRRVTSAVNRGAAAGW